MTTTLDATGQGLLAAVRANPDSDLERLVYADWLDDHPGQYERFRCVFCRTADTRCEWCAALNSTAAARDAALIREQIATRITLYVEDGDLAHQIGGVVRRGFLDEVRGPLDNLLLELPHLVRMPNAAVVRVTVTDRRPTVRDGETGHEYAWAESPSDGRFFLPQFLWRLLVGGYEWGGGFRVYPSREEAETNLSAALLTWAWDQPAPQEAR